MADLTDILNTLIAEAAGEGPEGMRRVAETILNRAAIRGISPAEVVRQPYQYTGFSNPGPAAITAQRDPASITAAEAAWALAQQPGDPTNGADHYFNPSIVNPSWKNSMVPTGDYGGHSFYSSQKVPVSALAALLAPQTREVAFPRTRPETRQVDLPRARPQSPGEQIAALFGGSFGTPQDAATSAGLNSYIGRQRAADDSLTLPGEVDRYVGSLTQSPSLGNALARMLAPRSAPAMPTGVRQSYAAQDAVRPSTAQAVAALLTPSRPAITAASSRVAADQRTLRDANQQAADAERNRTVVATVPTSSRSAITAASAKQAADQLMLRNANQQAADAERNRTTVATIPTSGVGAPPTTRVVQSVPVPASAARQTPAARTAPPAVGATPSYAGQERAVASRMTDTGNPVQFGDIAMMFGNTPQASSSVNAKKDQERLAPGGNWTVPENERLAMHGLDVPAPVQVAEVQEPVALPRRRPQVANTQVAVTQPPRRAVPAASPAMAYASSRPQHLASSATSAIARSVEPAGTFRTGTNGYVYSTNGNGGYQRVSTSRPAGMSAQQQYDWANALAAEHARASAPMQSSLQDRIASGDLWAAHR